MERGVTLLIATAMLFVATGVRATDLLSFANNTKVNITRTGCGNTKLCVETPNGCDPAGNSTCLFGSVTAGSTSAANGTDLSFQLSGNSTGYIALGLSTNASQGTTALFVCAQNISANGTFFFRTVERNNTNNELLSVLTPVTEIRGQVNNDKIQCEFNVPNVNATRTRSSDSTTFSILLGSGSVNGNNLGPFTVTLNSGLLNLANPGTTVATPTNTTNGTAATSGASGVLHLHAVTLLLSIVMLPVLKTA